MSSVPSSRLSQWYSMIRPAFKSSFHVTHSAPFELLAMIQNRLLNHLFPAMSKVIILLSFIFFVCASSSMRAKSPFARCSAPKVSVSGGMRSSFTSTSHNDVGISKDSRTILLSNKACRTRIGPFEIIAEECDSDISLINLEGVVPTPDNVIRLMDVGSGWGNGAHPTTKLCLNFILKAVTKGDKVLDYGTGSGILSIAAAKLGASHCVAVDIDEDTLIAAEINGRVNGVSDVLDVVHTRSVYVGEDRFPVSEVTVANILPVRNLKFKCAIVFCLRDCSVVDVLYYKRQTCIFIGTICSEFTY